MNVTMPQDYLQRISRYLQNQLQPQAKVIPLQVKCALKDTLWVLVQHPPGNAPDPQQIFTQLERSLSNLPQDYRAPLQATIQSAPIKLFIRVLGQQNPYAFHHVSLPDTSPEHSDANNSSARGAGDLHEFQTLIQAIPDDLPHADSAASPDINATFLQPESEGSFGEIPTAAPPGHTAPIPPGGSPNPSQSKRKTRSQAKAGWAFQSQDAAATSDSPFELESDLRLPDLEDSDAPITTHRPAAARWNLKPWLWGGAGLLGVMVVGVGIYALTRPCVIGACPAIAEAEAVTQAVTQTAKTGTPEATTQITQQLTTVQQQLADIPLWSSRYGDAQTWQRHLDQVLAAEAQASQAIANATPATQSLWSGAIAQLEAVPADSPLHGFAQVRLQTYRTNLALAQQRAQVEQTAQQRLTTAKKTAELAIARQNTAQTPADWQQASVTWQVVLNTLEQIPRDTSAHAEAQQLLASYRPQAATARDRATQEQKAKTLQTQATAYEKQAKAAQQRNQWSQAIAAWQNALKTAQQIPTNTSLGESAKTLVDTYRGSLSQAQAVVKIRVDLDRVCNASGRICNYTITNDTIQVQLLPAYERKVRTLGGLSQFSGDYDTLEKINIHLASLARALQTVSTNAGLPVQVYNSDKDLIAAFTPNG